MKVKPEGTSADQIREGESAELNAVYRERIRLVSGYTYRWPSILTPADDYPDMWIVYLVSPAGQLSWHLMPEDLDLFKHVERRRTWEWDGHTTEQKYERLELACQMEAGLRSGRP